MNNFEKLGIDPPVLKIIEKQGLVEPTEVQVKAIPLGLDGKDIVAMSATGSGKTLAFATVLAHNIDKEQDIQAIILTPTRELTEQVAQVVKGFVRSKRLEVAKVIGGVAMGPQIEQLKTADIVVGTPGRVLDHLTRRTMRLNSVKILILDEADRMFDMGFIRDVEKIMSYCPYNKQTMLFSATINAAVMRLSEKHMHKPVSVSVQNLVDPSKLKQVYYEVDKAAKLSLLIHLIKAEKRGLVMVFCNTRRTVDFVQNNLAANGVESHALHGGMAQNKRSKVIKDFHSNTVHVLVCTDVAARGLDIKGVEHIYNYNIPRDPTDYIHRIGRTARAGEAGKAISLLSEDEHSEYRGVLNKNTGAIQEIETPEVKRIIAKRLKPTGRPKYGGRGGGWAAHRGKPTGSRRKPDKSRSHNPRHSQQRRSNPKR